MKKKFKIFNISQVPFEEIHNTPCSRQTLATKDDLITSNIDALTKGTLKPGEKWDWHCVERNRKVFLARRSG
ncbi:hypothetical protein COY90_04570 [Candidatus Roizmanbacteria bacterium CG_4_10_14_0_8_um_filter_39_9]|uniref:Uncharacterized protein n=1 Tax=Candidatus Roizmanbacteria bacterium CG_4_10_14_0_8_um_filter_39_9 TaxID=1974829 RepID=A0A2M7QCU5_9BACT|nr:MAG: hypothetical protein COY90_04570 [Candidatus Roizmanbacteria bacterium CG_4_10_14_0_8_um_filter_39_9]